MEPIINLRDQVVVITGGGTGIGYGIAEQMCAQGAKVVITGRTGSTLKEARNRLGENSFYRVNDITDKKEHAKLIEDIESRIGPITTLVNNAGLHCKKPSMDITDEEFERVMNTNANAVFSLTRETLRFMIPRKKGNIIFISSMTAIYGLPQVVAYSASKSALLGMTRTLAMEYSSLGIRFNTIAPGFIESQMFREIMNKDPEREQRILKRTPAGRFGTPEDVAKAVAFLASDAASFITGVCLPVDGGNSIGF